MARKDYVLMIGLIILSGLIGGSLTSWLVSGTVTAENSTKPAKVLRAEKLQIVDSAGYVRIELSVEPLAKPGEPTRIIFYDKDGKAIQPPAGADVSADFSAIPRFQPKPRIRITNSQGRVIWSEPTRYLLFRKWADTAAPCNTQA